MVEEFQPNLYYAGQTPARHLPLSLYCAYVMSYICGFAEEENKINVFRTTHGLQYDKLVCLSLVRGVNVICYDASLYCDDRTTVVCTHPVASVLL